MELSELNRSIQSNNLLKETVDQLEKDFLMIGVNFDIEKPVSDYKDLFSFTFHLIDALNQQIPQRVLNLLYRIDLSEEIVKSEMLITQLSFTEMLSEMIVKRELKKVIIKNYYSKSENH